MSHGEIYITKANGQSEPFDYGKLRTSLERAGAGPEMIVKISDHIRQELQHGMSTTLIYKHALYLLRRFGALPVASRYSLRRAMIGFGPTGFPFEKYIAELFRAEGYEAITDQIIRGQCASHELDVVAWNERKLIMVEAKFHNHVGEKSDLKVALYVKARFDDISEQSFFYGFRRSLDEGWLITNTKFTQNAEQYGMCAGIHLVSWNHPAKGNLRDLIERTGLHPVTTLSNLSQTDKVRLLANGVVLAKTVKESAEPLKMIGINQEKIAAIQYEAKVLCDS